MPAELRLHMVFGVVGYLECLWFPLNSGYTQLRDIPCSVKLSVWERVPANKWRFNPMLSGCILSKPSNFRILYVMCVRSSYYFLKSSVQYFLPRRVSSCHFLSSFGCNCQLTSLFYIFLHLHLCNVWGNCVSARGHLLCQHIWLSIPAIPGDATFRAQSPAHLQNIPMFELAWVATECLKHEFVPSPLLLTL